MNPELPPLFSGSFQFSHMVQRDHLRAAGDQGAPFFLPAAQAIPGTDDIAIARMERPRRNPGRVAAMQPEFPMNMKQNRLKHRTPPVNRFRVNRFRLMIISKMGTIPENPAIRGFFAGRRMMKAVAVRMPDGTARNPVPGQ